ARRLPSRLPSSVWQQPWCVLSVLDDLTGLDADGARASDHRSLLVPVLGLGHGEGHDAAALAGLLVDVHHRADRREDIAHVDRREEFVFLLAVHPPLEVEGKTGSPASVVPVADRLQEGERWHDPARLARSVGLVEVQWVFVLDRASELCDLATLDVHGYRL